MSTHGQGAGLVESSNPTAYAQLYLERYKADASANHLNKALSWVKRAVESVRKGKPKNFSEVLNCYASILEIHFERFSALHSLEEAIRLARKAIELMPEDDPHPAVLVISLGDQLQTRFQRLGILDNLEEAIRVTRKAVKLTPEDDPKLTVFMNTLGCQLQTRFEGLLTFDDKPSSMASIKPKQCCEVI